MIMSNQAFISDAAAEARPIMAATWSGLRAGAGWVEHRATQRQQWQQWMALGGDECMINDGS